jgi:hypothetical protein
MGCQGKIFTVVNSFFADGRAAAEAIVRSL